MKKTNLTLVFALSLTFAYAQQPVSDALPANPGDGKCYAKCIQPDEYSEEEVRVMTKPAYKTLEVVPAEYTTETQTVIVKPQSKKFTYVPATYSTVTDTIWIREGYNKLTIAPSEFRDDTETVEIKPAFGKWIAGDKDPDCPSIEPEDCRIFYYKEYDKVTRDVKVERLVKNETDLSKKVTGKYELVSRQVEVTPAKYNEEVIPQETKVITKSVLVKDETARETTVPAEFTSITKRVLVKEGGMTVWREVPCTVPDDAIVLPINWEVGSAVLTPAAKRIIDDKLIAVAAEKSSAIIEIGSHTDARGSSENNQKLSEKRAKSVADYLISKNIDKERILAVGYGETKLKNGCADGVTCTTSQHSANRRTEFKLY